MNIFTTGILETRVVELEIISPTPISREPQETRNVSNCIESVAVANVRRVQRRVIVLPLHEAALGPVVRRLLNHQPIGVPLVADIYAEAIVAGTPTGGSASSKCVELTDANCPTEQM
jgi:hypothetical protein